MLLSEEQINDIVREAARGSATRRNGTTSQRIARAIEAAVLAELAKQEPVGLIRIRGGDVVHMEPYAACLDVPNGDYSLYAAPVVQPDMVMVQREPTEAMIDAAMNRYQHGSESAARLYMTMHRENFRCDYRAMIAAAEKEQK